ncbi:MAG: tetratricopeptide repeat protein, partial [Acidobacteriota bacterium]
EATSMPGLSGWESLRRVYALAKELSPADAEILISMSISARWLGEGTPNEKQLLAISEACGREAVSLAPGDGRVHYAAGRAIYDQGRVSEALEAFGRALELGPDPLTEAWATLYKAHCLHDLERWSEALAAYDEVDRSAFTAQSSWRSDVLSEQRAYCLFMAGRRGAALDLLNRILDRYELEPHLGYWAMSSSFWQLIEAGAPELLGRAERIDKLARQVASR